MKLHPFAFHSRRRAFTLVEMLIVITLIGLLAALMLGAYTYAMNSSRRRLTTGTFEAIKLGLERYNTEFGEYPQAAGNGQMMPFPPSQSTYDIAGAACLYQALTGDGFDQIKGVSANSNVGTGGSGPMSDGKTEGTTEIRNKMLVEVPPNIFTRKGSTYILIDGFGHPFQYVRAATNTQAAGAAAAAAGNNAGGNNNNNTAPTTVNSTYDLWSYGEDVMNTTQQSISALKDPTIAVKWIKNW